MWSWFNCYLSGRHSYGMWCEPGTIFLRCVHCGRRSGGWAVDARGAPPVHAHEPVPGHLRPSTVGTPRVTTLNRAAN